MSPNLKQNRIEERFQTLKKEGKKAFIPYIMCGDPSLEKTAQLVKLLEECGADAIELGVPFSDPLADGPVIQAAGLRALNAGVNLRVVIEFVKKVRTEKFTDVPLILMTYFNPVFRYGEDAFILDARAAGVDGVIIPDLPVEEGDSMAKSAGRQGLDVIFLAAPTSGDERLKKVARASNGFIYFVSITGITGAKLEISEELRSSLAKLEGPAQAGQKNQKPVVVGFGIRTPGEAGMVSALADGVVIGSAIVKAAAESSDAELKEYLLALRAAIK
ncbi:MAG: tryptophan synthase subunit alpha [Nitrospiraceae bacterium]|nr:tryptophan synthase subunit alpha [Nitrospiraceae bacterium]